MIKKIHIDIENYKALMAQASRARGDYAEFGVSTGKTFAFIYKAALKYKRHAYAVDSFIGMPEPTVDGDMSYPEGMFDCGGPGTFRKMFGKAIVCEGFIPEILTEIENVKFAFVHIDLDHETSTRQTLDWVWSRMASGGIIVCHDYWPDEDKLASKAINEWMDENNIKPSGIKNYSIWFTKTDGCERWDIVHCNKPLVNEDWDILGDGNYHSPFKSGEESCYIVAPGFNGMHHCDKIPSNAFVIAVNYAITIQELNPAIWLCADENLLRCDWFINKMDLIEEAAYPIGLSDIKAGGPVVPVFDGKNKLCQYYPYVRSIFSAGPSMNRRAVALSPGILRVGLTISCQAIQLAYWLGAQKIILCGIDMIGRKYFDSVDSNVSYRRDKPWPQVSRINQLIRWLIKQGVEIYSLSDTALQVEVLDHAD